MAVAPRTMRRWCGGRGTEDKKHGFVVLFSAKMSHWSFRRNLANLRIEKNRIRTKMDTIRAQIPGKSGEEKKNSILRSNTKFFQF